MKTAVHFGAGKIGRGFIAELLHDSGYQIVFADVVDALVDLVNRDHEYSLFLIDHDFEEKVIDHIVAYSTIKEPEKVIEAIGKAEVITTSVMATNLPKIAPLLAEGLKRRLENGGKKVIVMACENAIMGTDILKNAMIDTGIISEDELNMIGAYPNTAVDRMVFDGIHHGKEGIEIGDAFELAIEREKLPDPSKEPIRNAEYVDNLEMFLKRKIYMINCGHALAGYFGQIKGYKFVQDALRDQKIQSEVCAAVMESAAALEKQYGFTHESLVEYMETMMIQRFLTPGVKDEITRVSREPIRKISPKDRIMGPAYQCEVYGLDNQHLLKGVAYALKYYDSNDEQSVEIRNAIETQGIENAITKYTGVEEDSRMHHIIYEEYKKIGEE